MKKLQTFLTVCCSCLICNNLYSQRIETVNIPAGTFYMGSTDATAGTDESPIHPVTLTYSFRMGVTEVTNAQFEEFMPSHKKYRGKNGLSCNDNDAVVYVSYQDAVDFCTWLSKKEGKNYRLPTEAEWEYACRAGSYTPYNTGDALPEEMCKNQVIARDYQPVSLKVAQSAPNAFGLYDMHGNVEEWCYDWYGAYSSEAQTNPVGPDKGEYKITRGGSHHTPVQYLRSATRMAMIPEDKHSLTGFRVVESDFNPISCRIDKEKAFFLPPIPYVIPPSNKKIPFYKHNHQPSLTWCDNGDLLAVWFSANEENSREMAVLSSRLKKGTRQWSEAELFLKIPGRNLTGTSLFNNGKGELLHLNGVEAAGDWQNLMMILRRSHDNGLSWSKPQIIASEHTKRHQVISGTSRSKEGYLIQACDAGPGSHDGSAIHISKDEGTTWTDPWDGKALPDFNKDKQGSTIAGIHAGVVALKDGTLMALGRGNSIVNQEGKKRMPMSLSHDLGKTWTYSPSPFPPIDGGQRLVLMRLNEGAILLVSFTDHPQRTPEKERGMTFTAADGTTYTGYGMYAAVSYDEGKTWPVKKLLTDGTTRFLNGGAWTGHFIMDATHAEPRGYLAGTQTPDNTIHIVSSNLYYQFNLKWLEKK